MSPRTALIAAALLTLGGCASYEKSDAVAAEDGGATAPKRMVTGQPPAEGDGGTADPYRERAGARQEVASDDADGSSAIAFREPKRWPKPLPAAKRPTFPAQAKLAFAQVRSGDLSFAAKPVLALETLLEQDPGLKSVTALPAPRARAVTLAALAKQAHTAGRALLLIDLRPGRKGEPREGLLVWTRTAALLDTYPIAKDAQPPPAPSDGAPLDLLERLRVAYARLESK